MQATAPTMPQGIMYSGDIQESDGGHDLIKCIVILPKRLIVKRTFARLNQCRRLAKDWEVSIASAEAWMFAASIRRMTLRIAKIEF